MAMLGFAPDAPMMEPGILLDCKNLVPSTLGMKPAKGLVRVGADALPADAMGAFLSINLTGVRTIYAGTATKLFQLANNSWTDVSGGATFGLPAGSRWSFVQFGNSVLAAAKSEDMQIATGSNFADVGGSAPKARILVSLKGFVMAFDTNEATYGDQTDRWWCSAYLDASDWTPDVATMCTTGRLVESAGAIVAAERLGDDVVAYKRDSTYLGRFTGPAEVWNWAFVDSEVGCVGPDAVCSTGTVHYFLNRDDICMFDGVQVRSIARGVVRDWYKKQRDPDRIEQARAFWDKDAQLAWFFFAGNDGEPKGLVYSPNHGRWGRVDYAVSMLLRYSSPAVTYSGGSPLVTTYNGSALIEYDSPLWILAEETMGAFDADNELVSFSGASLPSSFTTGDYGDENEHTWCDRLTLRLHGEPTTSNATGYVKDSAGTVSQSAQAAIRDDGAFDMRQRARWHRFLVESTGNYALIDIKPRLRQAGYR